MPKSKIKTTVAWVVSAPKRAVVALIQFAVALKLAFVALKQDIQYLFRKLKELSLKQISQSTEKKIKAFLFTRTEQQAFLEDVSGLIQDGVPASQAVRAVADIAKSPTKDVALEIMKKISQGKQIADGMQDWFPQPIVEIIRAGEEGGSLAENMTAASKALSQQSKGVTSLVNSLVYPLVVVVMGLGVAVFVKHSVFVNFAEIKPINQWPSNGRILYGVATFMQNWWWLVILIAIVFVFLLSRLLRELTGTLRSYLDNMPILSLYRDGNAARFMETLGLLLVNGIVLKRGLIIMRNKASHYMSWHIYLMELRLSGGRENIAEVLDTGLVSKNDIMRLRLIAKGKGFEHALVRMGRVMAERNTKAIELTGKIFGIIVLVAGAAWAAYMIFAIYAVGSFVAT